MPTKTTKKKTRTAPTRSETPAGKPVRYAVVGLGYISQVALLPAFKHAGRNSQLAALVSDDPEKLEKLGRKYRVETRVGYEDFDELLADGGIDAVYIGLPNSMHHEYTLRAAAAGVHVLCEKPLAVTEQECEEMIRACKAANVRLMTAYRLHFEPATLKAVEIARSGKIGDLRIFNSVFTMQVEDKDNIRLKADMGGGPLYDIGIYCINAARTLFRAEPREVFAYSGNRGDARFREVDEMTACVLRYPEDRLATFTCSFGASPTGYYQLVGTRGDLCVDPSYEYAEPLAHMLTIDEKTTERTFKHTDQFAAELLYFSDCVRLGKEPEPSGLEGLADVRIIRALLESAATGRPVAIQPMRVEASPTPSQVIVKPAIKKPELVNAQSPSGD